MRSPSNYPIVLAHGIARFDFLRDSLWQRLRLFLVDRSFVPDRTHYFKGVATHLKKHGFDTHHTSVSFAAGVAQRARELRQEVMRVLTETGQEKVHLIGHSMGGLDARHMIVHEEMAGRVASLTTIGTPHLGTSFATVGLTLGGEEAIHALRQVVNLEGFLTLTPEKRQAFNEAAQETEAANDVLYQTYASQQAEAQVFGLIRPSWRIIHEREGENDGLVPVSSQAWVSELVSRDGRVKKIHQHRFPFPADHLNQTGWWHIDRLRQTRWWQQNVIKEKGAYETAVKNIYLKIAREVTAAGQG